MRLAFSVSELFRDIQYINLRQKTATADRTKLEEDIISNYKRKKGILRDAQLDIIYHHDLEITRGLQL